MTEYEEKLVMDNLRLVDHIIRTRFHYWSASVLMSYEDLQAVGREALCRAAVRYKPDSAFAGRCIVNALIDHCNRDRKPASAECLLQGVHAALSFHSCLPAL